MNDVTTVLADKSAYACICISLANTALLSATDRIQSLNAAEIPTGPQKSISGSSTATFRSGRKNTEIASENIVPKERWAGLTVRQRILNLPTATNDLLYWPNEYNHYPRVCVQNLNGE